VEDKSIFDEPTIGDSCKSAGAFQGSPYVSERPSFIQQNVTALQWPWNVRENLIQLRQDRDSPRLSILGIRGFQIDSFRIRVHKSQSEDPG
jgi:hypothetical protein